MADILILGGTGATGRLLAPLLLEHTTAGVALGARRLERAQALAAELNRRFPGGRASAVALDAADAASLRSAFQGRSLVVVAAPTTAYTQNVARAALEAGADYLDVQLSAAKLAVLQSLADEIERAGRCFITEAGFHPGLPSALVRWAAGRLDEIERAVTAGYLNMGRGLPYTEAVDELVESFRDYQAQVYQGGRWTAAGAYEMRRIDFGGDIGLRRCYAMFFEELRALPEMYPTLRECGFYISESHWMVDFVVMPLVFAWLKLFPRSRGAVGRFLWWGMTSFHRPPYRVELQVQASGIKDGRPAEVSASVAHPDGYALTAIPVAAALLQVLDGSARRPGLWMMGHLVDPERLLDDMQRLGAEVHLSA